MKSPEIYREHAASARRLASRSGNEEEHACLLALARQWQREADLLEERQAQVTSKRFFDLSAEGYPRVRGLTEV